MKPELRPSVIEAMRQSIQVLDGGIADEFVAIVHARLAVCQACPELQADGCGDCRSCGTRWKGMRTRVIEGTCPKYEAVSEANHQKPKEKQPQRKVNNMFVHLYIANYVTPGTTTKKTLRIAAQNLKALQATFERIEPDAELIDARVIGGIDGIADGVVVAEIERYPVEQRQQQVPPMAAGGVQPLTLEQAKAMGFAGPVQG